ncbi:S41 family peptidase [Xanthomonadaceae bacterium JHOS43]|nr:S41 family peptidase [Xanthomonadaceae bacterium JHOS43]
MRAWGVLLGLLVMTLTSAQEPGYLRQPAIHGDTVVFTAEGDLWSVSASGGLARRLTTYPSEESRAAISPDGSRVAFTAAYAGPREAYVMPLAGGVPKRISFENGNALVLGWSAQGQVLYGTLAPGGTGGSQRVVVAVTPDTLERRTLPLAEANDAVLAADGRTLYFVRYGLGVTGDNARGYRGGALSQLWRFDLESNAEAVRIGPTDVNLRQPMWVGERLVVIADPDGRDVLAQLDPEAGTLTPLPIQAPFDVRNASASGQRIVYQSGADLRLFDLASGQDSVLPVRLLSDFAQRQPRWLDTSLKYLEGTDFSADGQRVALVARGRVVVAGVGAPRRVDIGSPDGVRLSAAVFSPDRKHVYAVSDASGEEEIWRFSADGSADARQLTRDGRTQRHGMVVSPDGKWLAHGDKSGRLWLLDPASGRNRLIDDGGKDGNEGHDDVVWATDSRHLALVRPTGAYGRARIALYSLERDELAWLTSDKYESFSPAFSPDGRWLWFLSEREFSVVNGSPWGDRNTGPFFDKRSRIYALALQPDARFPFRHPDELQIGADDQAKSKSNGGSDDAIPPLAWDGLAERLHEVPLAAGNWSDLSADSKRLYFLGGEERRTLHTLAFDEAKAKLETFTENIAEYALAPKVNRLMLRTAGKGPGEPGDFYIVEAGASAPKELADSKVRLGDWKLRVDPVTEWRQMFDDAWRMHRDHFYDAALRGVDWPALRQRYAALLPRVSDRLELDDLLAQMMGELGALHSQVRGGELREGRETPSHASLGASFARTDAGWRIEHIFRTEAELPSQRGPLQAPGVDARVGDVIVSINGRRTIEVADISELLANTAGQQILLEISRAGTMRREIVTPVDAQRKDALRYSDWVQTRRDAVAAAGEGRIGYLHLRAMGPNDIAGFVREFYAQIDRDGLIIDVRRNRGGNIDSWIIEKLLRRTWAFWQRPSGLPYGNMQQSFRGHLAVLTDALTYSDGETFAAGVQALKLGPLLGTRTAGAGVWLTDSNALVDRGRARVAEIPQYGLDGRWLVEGVGVGPDIEVDNLPHESFNGRDRQLETALEWLRRKLEAEPVQPLRRGTIPALPAQ